MLLGSMPQSIVPLAIFTSTSQAKLNKTISDGGMDMQRKKKLREGILDMHLPPVSVT